MTLADFLLARIAEDEATAWRDGNWQSLGWKVSPVEDEATREDWDCWVEEAHSDSDPVALADDREAQHIARWDPARVLVECEAKRRVVAEHEAQVTSRGQAEGLSHLACQTCEPYPPMEDPSPGACLTLRLVALPYADHPDYDKDWRP